MYNAQLILAATALLANGTVKPSASLGKVEATCRTNESGPVVYITVKGLKDRKGLLRAELYPPNEKDFLADDAILVNAGKTFRRVDLSVPASGDPVLCMRIPAAGTYTLSILHDRDRNLKFSAWSDGIGFSGNPKVGRSKPKAAAVTFSASTGITRINVTMNYLSGISMQPIKKK
jgi:uncharacterized protein (DUF2141 family)